MQCALIRIRAQLSGDGHQVLGREFLGAVEDKEMLLDKVARLLADDFGKVVKGSVESSLHRSGHGLQTFLKDSGEMVNS